MAYGDELENRLETGWGGLLASRLGVEYINLAACAGSNSRVVRLTVEKLRRYTAERGIRPDEVLFLGMWTRINRFEIHAGEPDRQGGLPEEVPDPGWCRIHPAYIARRDQRSIRWYRHLQNDFGDRAEFLMNWLLLDAWLDRNGYRRGYLWAFEPSAALFDGMEQYVEQIDWTRVMGIDTLPYGGPSLFSVGESLDDLGPSRHPLNRSQKLFVDNYVDEWVRDLLARPHRTDA
ncbi:DUF6071 family protein [Streptomyces sp. NPDC094034]|uniref:DUF6071 family protein n=1 Tax=Streptomyces sp. NPDC094034 TaxID=3155309 RepID=UPI003326DC27